jgi:hypothetical protein
MGKNHDLGSGMNIQDDIAKCLKKGKNLKFFYAVPDPGSGIFFTLAPGSGIFLTLDAGSAIFLTLNPGSGMEKFGSGIRDGKIGSEIRDKHPGSATLNKLQRIFTNII